MALPSTSEATRGGNNNRTLIICDVQPDIVRKLPQSRKFLDLTTIAIRAAQKRGYSIIYTLLNFNEPGYVQINALHPRLGVLRRLGEKDSNMKWFTSGELSVVPSLVEGGTVVARTTFLPHARDDKLMEVLHRCCSDTSPGTVTVLGYGPTVQAICNILGDAVVCPGTRVIKECIADERGGRRHALLEHGLLFDEQIISLVDILEETDLLHERIDLSVRCLAAGSPPPNKYVCDTGRGGHLCLYMPYLIRDHGYTEWPTQPWYQENALTSNKQYNCPLGRSVVDLCDEPKFSSRMRFFLSGRQHLDEKDLLHRLVPDLMPPTFDSIESAQTYAAEFRDQQEGGEEEATKLLWFVKKANQNGGRAVRVTSNLSSEGPLESDDQLQAHVPRPLLYDGQFKFHVKTYQHISCGLDNVWKVYMHDLFYLATASSPWSVDDLSDAAQITTMRTHRLYADNEFRKLWNLTEVLHGYMCTLMERAVGQGKLQVAPSPDVDEATSALPQFEINSADWMLDQDGRVYLIECNGIPVLYDPTSPKKQALVTKGLKLYNRLYQEDPDAAVVNDTDLIREALDLALTGKLPKATLWKHVATIPAPGTAVEDKEK